MGERRTLGEIEELLKKNEAILKEKFNVKELGIFGSYVRREQKNKSDVDILVEFYKPLDLFAFIELEDFLSALLGIKVDLVMKSALKPRIKDRILKEAIYL
jgi:predicted nucleotidyltransferase